MTTYNGYVEAVPGGIFVTLDWLVSVFGLDGIINRLSYHLYMQNIPISGCMDICSCYILFVLELAAAWTMAHLGRLQQWRLHVLVSRYAHGILHLTSIFGLVSE